jgi:hypothetical protein
MSNDPQQPERPRVEPEIIPPDRSRGAGPRRPGDRGMAWPPPPYGYTQSRGAHRIFVRRIGPLGFALLLLMIGLFGGVLLLIMIGAALLWIPLLAVVVIAAAISGVFRRL